MQTILSDGGGVYKFWKKSSLGNANRICSKFQSLGHLDLLPGRLKHGDCEVWKDTPYDYPYHESYLVICESRRRVSLLNCILHVTSIFSVLPCIGQGSIRERESGSTQNYSVLRQVAQVQVGKLQLVMDLQLDMNFQSPWLKQ